MLDYRCCFFGPDGKVAAQRDFQAPDDRHALILARAFYGERATRYGFELWRAQDLVHREA